MPTRNELRIAITVLLIGVVLAVPTVVGRLQVEQAYRTYEVAVDFESLRILAGVEGHTLTDAALALKNAGVTSLSVQIQSISGLLTHGDAIFVPSDTQLAFASIGGLTEVKAKGGYLYLPQGYVAQSGLSPLVFSRTYIGLDPQAVAAANEAGLELIARVPAVSRITPEEVTEIFKHVEKLAGRSVIFDGQMILGYPDRLGLVSDHLVSLGLLLGEVEFSTQKGLDLLTRKHTDRLVRVHTITPEETDLIGFDTALARWVRAVQERNVRVLYIHPFLPHSAAVQGREASALETSGEMIRAVTSTLSKAGYQAATAKRLPVFPLFDWGFLGAVLGLVSLAYLMFHQALGKWWTQRVQVFIWAAAIFSAVSLTFLYFLGYTILARQVVALGVAIVFPVMSVLIAMSRERGVIVSFLHALAILTAGAILIVAALAQPEFILKTEQFLGVKLMHILPPALVAWSLWQQGLFRGWTVNRVTLLVVPLILIAGVYLVLRTGNIAAVSDWERHARDVLERVLIARPRTKEFMLGHPALLAGLWLHYHTANRVGAAALLTIGTIGMLSVLNTFTHIHTALVVSALRTFNGLWLGLLVGAIAILALRLIVKEDRG